MKKLLVLVIAAVFMLCWAAGASAVEMKTSGYFLIGGGSADNLGFTEDHNPLGAGSNDHNDPGFEACREMGLQFDFIANENLKGVLSFQIGEGGDDQGGFFGDTNARVGGEEDGDDAVELDKLYLDFNWPGTEVNFRIGSQVVALPDTISGSQIMLEVPPAAIMNAPIMGGMSLTAGWVRMSNDLTDSERNEMKDEEADLYFLSLPIEMQGIKLNPYAAYALIGKNYSRAMHDETVCNDDGSCCYKCDDGGYDFMNIWPNYDYIIGQATGNPTSGAMTNLQDDINAYYAGLRFDVDMFDPLVFMGSINYGYMEIGDIENNTPGQWEDENDVEVSGFHIDGAIDYKMDFMTPELFGFWSEGPDDEDEELDMYPALVAGVDYTTNYFEGSLWNDQYFEGTGRMHAMSCWAVGLKFKDIKLINKLTNEIQVAYIEGTADEDIVTSPGDNFLNEDESVVDLCLNSKYQLYENLAAVSELGYSFYDDDSDYDEEYGDDEDAYKITVGLKYSF